MPKQIPPIDDDIYEFLQDEAIPLEDDINSVLRRLLGLNRSRESLRSTKDSGREGRGARHDKPRVRTQGRTRAPKGSILAEEAYELPILTTLVELGGRAPTSEVIDHVGALLDGKLTPADREKVESGDVRWRNRAQFVRLSLIKKGDLNAGSPRGVWEVSDQGRRRVGSAA